MSSKAVETIRAKSLIEAIPLRDGFTVPTPPSRSQLFPPLLDFLALIIIWFVVYSVASNTSERALPGMGALAFGLGFCVVLVLTCKRLGLYATLPVESLWSEIKLILKAEALTQLLAMSALYLTHTTAVTPAILLALAIASPLWLIAARQMRSSQTEQRIAAGLLTRNVLIIGHGEIGCALRDQLQNDLRLGYLVRGFLDDTSQAHDVLGTTHDLERTIRTHFIDQIYITTHTDRDLVKTLTLKAPRLGVDVSIVPDLFDGIGWNAPVDRVGHFPVLVLHRRHAYALQRLLKRMIDVLGALILGIVSTPIMALVAILIKLESDGPVFYKAERVGRKGRIFHCYKFRTMYAGADQKLEQVAHLNDRGAPLFKARNDPRMTPFGRFLRRYSLDEFPQLINVLVGEMSLVGPRPPTVAEYRQFKLEHLRKLDVFPGITGLWQVTCRTDPSFQSYIRCDLEYIENWSLSLDLEILARTVVEVLRGTGS
jgi:exopolysaccharide biosynthesis polyprenyl glycosylphosphotransferase